MIGNSRPGLARPTASLSSTLLARKGAARPAMRAPGFGAGAPDDLGWNDMGNTAAPAEAPVPPVLAQRAVLHAEFAAPPTGDAPRTVSVATAARIGRETRAGHAVRPRAAFTLRLDTDRHLKLRLASALCNRSAQHLVTEALDAFLETLPDVDMLVSQLPAPGAR